MTTNVAACKALIDSQAIKGLNKYTVPLEKSDASLSHLARHGAEEMADALAYFVALEAKATALEAEIEMLRSRLDGEVAANNRLADERANWRSAHNTLHATLTRATDYLGHLLDHLPEDKRDSALWVECRAALAGS